MATRLVDVCRQLPFPDGRCALGSRSIFAIYAHKGCARARFETDLDKLELVLLTHAHNDHLDLNLIRAIAPLPIRWIVPRFMLKGSLAREFHRNIIVPAASHCFKDLTITPFHAQHIHGKSGISETGYLVECGGKRWLFPGDTRVYDACKYHLLCVGDTVFAHVWLGKASPPGGAPTAGRVLQLLPELQP